MAGTRRSVVLVTGASSGIGEALARRLAADGASVVIAARRRDRLDAIAAAIGARPVTLDVRDADATAATIAALDDELGGFDVVIANAGIGLRSWAGELSWPRAGELIDVNVRGAVATLTAVLPRMVERRRGHLVGISSLAAYRGLPHNALYSASKAFLSTFLEGLRVDLAPTGVRVTDVRPGFVRTPMLAGHDGPQPFAIDPERAADAIVDGIAGGRAIVSFPWPTAWIGRTLALMPAPIFDRAARFVRPPEPGPRQRG